VIVLPTALFVADIPWAIVRKDREGRIFYADAEFAMLHGFVSSEALIGKTDRDLFPKHLFSGAAKGFRSNDLRVVHSGKTLDTVEECVNFGDRRIIVRIMKVPLRDAKGKITGVETRFRFVS